MDWKRSLTDLQDYSRKITFKKLVLYTFKAGVLTGLLLTVYTGFQFYQWNSNKEEILKKLYLYKKQLDYFRSHAGSNDSGSEVLVGAVPVPSKIYDRNGVLIGEFFSERRTIVPINEIPEFVPNALIASEDREFMEHRGVRLKSIIRAVVANLVNFGYSQGGSTLTQQLAKVLFTNQEKTIKRKIYELFCTFAIENRFTKEQILEMYLNLVYIGHGNYGVESSSYYYFNKSSSFLTLSESAMLIGILPNPNNFSPINNLEVALRKQKTVLQVLINMGKYTEEYVSKDLKRFYRTWNIHMSNETPVSDIGKFRDNTFKVNLAPYFIDYVRQDLLNYFEPDILTRGGLHIYTTLDYRRQQTASTYLLRAINKQKDYYARESGNEKLSEKTRTLYSNAIKKTNGAFISISPQNGEILTMIGGSEFSGNNQFNRAVLAQRQVGSLIKPFIYYLAIESRKITPASIVHDQPVKYGDFKFDNYTHRYQGDITAYKGLVQSINTIAVQLLDNVGVSHLRDLISDILPLTSAEARKKVPNEIGVALGTSAFSPYEMATLYATMVNDGKLVEPHYLVRVEDPRGNILMEPSEEKKMPQVLDPDSAFITVSMLKGVFEHGGTSGWVARLRNNNQDFLPFEISGKTGTTSDYRDAWFAGITSQEVSIIWIGADDNTTLGSGHAGGALCAPVWVEYANQVYKKKHPEPFKSVFSLNDITWESFCPLSGGVPVDDDLDLTDFSVREQPFLAGSEPGFFCPIDHHSDEKGKDSDNQ